MVSDQEIAKGVETVLRQSDPTAITSLNGVVQQLEAKLGLNLSHKAGFIKDQISLLLRAHPSNQPPPPQKDRFAPQHQPQPQFPPHHQQQFPPHHQQQFPPRFALQHHSQFPSQVPNFPQPQSQLPLAPRPAQSPLQVQPQPQPQPQLQPPVTKPEVYSHNVAAVVAPEVPKESAPVGAKRRGGPGGLNKVCGVSPALQTIVGEPALPRTEIVKQLWAYIRKNNLQDPSNKRKIICDDALRLVFETDCTDMFKMNKLLAKHITALEPTKESAQAKRAKVEVESTTESIEHASPVIISEALAKFLGTGEREMLATEAERLVWEYVNVNHLEDPLNPMVVICDAKLRELLGCESISVMGIHDSLLRHHLLKHS
ncbi:hypothetical protein SLE2022_367490 [Rubroshorea leprosula]